MLKKKKDDLSSDAADAGLHVGAPTPGAVGQKGWLRVASDEFMDKNKYPDVPVLEAGATKPSNWDFITWAQTNGVQKFSNSIGNS